MERPDGEGAWARLRRRKVVQWGDTGRALDWLETALRDRDPYLAYTKVNFFFDPLRNEPRFQAIERALKFPD